MGEVHAKTLVAAISAGPIHSGSIMGAFCSQVHLLEFGRAVKMIDD